MIGSQSRHLRNISAIVAIIDLAMGGQCKSVTAQLRRGYMSI